MISDENEIKKNIKVGFNRELVVMLVRVKTTIQPIMKTMKTLVVKNRKN
jgi:hypothetical protein